MSIILGEKILSGLSINTKSNAHSLFDFKWSDHILNEMSWLRSDTFSWHNGDLYKAAYNHLVADYNNIQTKLYAWDVDIYTTSPEPSVGDTVYKASGASWGFAVSYVASDYSFIRAGGVAQLNRNPSIDIKTNTETVGSYTITYYLADDGHKIVLANQETTVQNIYNQFGVAWYYILDTTNTRFKLPRVNPDLEKQMGNRVISAAVVGNGSQIGFTDVGTGSATTAPNLYLNVNIANSSVGSHRTAGSTGALGITTDPTKSGMVANVDLSPTNSLYSGKKYLYFYVGQYSQTATEQTAGLNSELFNGKADVDLSNAASNASASAKQTIVGWGIPDYDSAVSLSAPTTSYQDYTATKPCMIELLCFYMAGALTYKINNHEYNIGGNTTSQQQGGCLMHIYLDTGDVLSYKTQYTNQGTIVVNRATMFPLKGA